MAAKPIVYCLSRDRDLVAALDARLTGALAFFYNDAARLHQAVILRAPDAVIVDTGAIRADYGDAGLGPVLDFLRRRASAARLAVRPTGGSDHLVAAEAGPGVELLPAELAACVDAVVGSTPMRGGGQ
jgi:hypothetical protein